MYRKCILKIPPCYDIKYSDQSWNVITGTKPCCKKCVVIFCHQTIPIIHAPTSATPYTLPTTGNQKPLTILVTCFIYKLPVLIFCTRIVYCKFLLLYKNFFDVFNKLSALMFCVRIVYRQFLLLYKIPSCLAKLFRCQMSCKPTTYWKSKSFYRLYHISFNKVFFCHSCFYTVNLVHFLPYLGEL